MKRCPRSGKPSEQIAWYRRALNAMRRSRNYWKRIAHTKVKKINEERLENHRLLEEKSQVPMIFISPLLNFV